MRQGKEPQKSVLSDSENRYIISSFNSFKYHTFLAKKISSIDTNFIENWSNCSIKYGFIVAKKFSSIDTQTWLKMGVIFQLNIFFLLKVFIYRHKFY